MTPIPQSAMMPMLILSALMTRESFYRTPYFIITAVGVGASIVSLATTSWWAAASWHTVRTLQNKSTIHWEYHVAAPTRSLSASSHYGGKHQPAIHETQDMRRSWGCANGRVGGLFVGACLTLTSPEPFYEDVQFMIVSAVVILIGLAMISRYILFPTPQPERAHFVDPDVPYPTSSFVAGRMDLTEPCLCHLSERNIVPPLQIRIGALLVHPTLLADIEKNPLPCTILSVPHHGMETLNGPPTDVWRFNHHPWT
ncbi:hypothetical protein EDD15DRAFT_2196943 [Pisolithus albus]|nr:hypothetical protein EDD15DRAFT_2196943 [Pisolithus albus]